MSDHKIDVEPLFSLTDHLKSSLSHLEGSIQTVINMEDPVELQHILSRAESLKADVDKAVSIIKRKHERMMLYQAMKEFNVGDTVLFYREGLTPTPMVGRISSLHYSHEDECVVAYLQNWGPIVDGCFADNKPRLVPLPKISELTKKE